MLELNFGSGIFVRLALKLEGFCSSVLPAWYLKVTVHVFSL